MIGRRVSHVPLLVTTMILIYLFRVQLTASSNRQPRYWTPEFLHLGHELHKCSPQCCSTPPMHYHSYSPLPSLLGCLRRTRTFTCCNSYSGVSLNYLRSALKTKSKEEGRARCKLSILLAISGCPIHNHYSNDHVRRLSLLDFAHLLVLARTLLLLRSHSRSSTDHVSIVRHAPFPRHDVRSVFSATHEQRITSNDQGHLSVGCRQRTAGTFLVALGSSTRIYPAFMTDWGIFDSSIFLRELLDSMRCCAYA